MLCYECVVEDARGDHIEEAYSRSGLMTALYIYKWYYNVALTYLCELFCMNESYVNTRLGADHHQLIMPPIIKDCSNTFSFTCDNPCERNKLSECIRTSNFDLSRKSVKTI